MADYTSNSNYGTEAQRGHPPAQTVSHQTFSSQYGVKSSFLGQD